MFNLIIEDEEKFNKTKFFITGFHGLGSVGYIATKHLIDEMKATRVAIIKSKAAPSFIYIEDNKIVMPFELYAVDQLLIFLPRLPPYRHAENEFSEALVNWLITKRDQFKGIYLIGGVDQSLKMESDSNVRFVPTREILKTSEEKGIFLEQMLSPGLMIQGPLAMMLGLLDINQYPGLGVLAFAERERPDPQGAAYAIETLNKLIKIDCPIGELTKNAALYEDELKNLPSGSDDQSGPPETYT